MEKCKIHPTYKGKRKPTCKCKKCQEIYEWIQYWAGMKKIGSLHVFVSVFISVVLLGCVFGCESLYNYIKDGTGFDPAKAKFNVEKDFNTTNVFYDPNYDYGFIDKYF